MVSPPRLVPYSTHTWYIAFAKRDCCDWTTVQDVRCRCCSLLYYIVVHIATRYRKFAVIYIVILDYYCVVIANLKWTAKVIKPLPITATYNGMQH